MQQQQQMQQMPATPGNYPAAYPYGLADYLLDTTLLIGIELFQRSVIGPVDRVTVLTAVEGELIRQQRLPSTGFGGVFGCVKYIWKKEGFSGLFRGVLTDFVFALPAQLIDTISTNIVFLVMKALIPESYAQTMGVGSIVFLSLAATVLGSYVAAPYNSFRKTVTTNYVSDVVAPVHPVAMKEGEEEGKESPVDVEEGYRFNGPTEVAMVIGRKKGWKAFYRGIHVEPVLTLLYRGLFIISSVAIPQSTQIAHPYLISRGLALIADVLTQPLEVVSRRIVLTASAEDDPYEGVMDCIRQIKETEGVSGLWTGLKFRLALSFISMGARVVFSGLFSPSEY